MILISCFQEVTIHEERTLSNPLFVFSNSMNQDGHPIIPFDKQAALLKKYGFAGLEHVEIENIFELKKSLDKKGLKVYASYVKIDIDQKEPYLKEWKEVIPQLKDSGIILWCHLHSKNFSSSDEAADALIVPIIQELADFAEPFGVKVAIYHHTWFLAEKAEDSYRIAQKVNRKNVGAVFNLPHFLKTDSEENLVSVLNLIYPKLFAVSICGADSGETKNMDWDQLIKPLGQGSFNTYHLVEYLVKKGFRGPFGLQTYGLKGAPEIYLQQSGEAWNFFKQRYTVSYKENPGPKDQFDVPIVALE